MRRYPRIVPLEEAAARDYAALTPGLEKRSQRSENEDAWDLDLMMRPTPAPLSRFQALSAGLERHTYAPKLTAADPKTGKQAHSSSKLQGSRAEDPFEISIEGDDENQAVPTARTLTLKRKTPYTQLSSINKRAKAVLPKAEDLVTTSVEDRDLDLQNKGSAGEEDADQDSSGEDPDDQGAGSFSSADATEDVPSSAGEFPISNRRFFDTEASAQDVLDGILAVLPELHPSSPMIREFLQRIKDKQYPQPVIPHWDADTGRFTEYDPELEAFWVGVVKDEPKLKKGTYHEGLDMDPRLIKAPCQTFDSAVVTLSSNPTKSSTVHLYP